MTKKCQNQQLVVKNIIGLVTITQVFVLIFEHQKPLFLQNLAKNSALKRSRIFHTRGSVRRVSGLVHRIEAISQT